MIWGQPRNTSCQHFPPWVSLSGCAENHDLIGWGGAAAPSKAKDARVLRQCMDGCGTQWQHVDAFPFRVALKLLNTTFFFLFPNCGSISAHVAASWVWCFVRMLLNPPHHHRHIRWGVMGSKLTRQRSLDFDSKLSKRRRQRNDSPGEGDRSGGRDFLFTSLMLKSDKLPGMLRKSNHSPYVRRVAWIREIQRLLREQKTEQASEVLKLLRKV